MTTHAHIHDEIRALHAAHDLMHGDLQKALVWFKSEPIREFDGKTPELLVMEGRANDVLKLLEMYETGSAG